MGMGVWVRGCECKALSVCECGCRRESVGFRLWVLGCGRGCESDGVIRVWEIRCGVRVCGFGRVGVDIMVFGR